MEHTQSVRPPVKHEIMRFATSLPCMHEMSPGLQHAHPTSGEGCTLATPSSVWPGLEPPAKRCRLTSTAEEQPGANCKGPRQESRDRFLEDTAELFQYDHLFECLTKRSDGEQFLVWTGHIRKEASQGPAVTVRELTQCRADLQTSSGKVAREEGSAGEESSPE